MKFHSLRWRIGLPFVGFVLAGSVVLLWLSGSWRLREERDAFVRLADTNAEFVARTRLPASERLAAELQQVLGVQVCFRQKGRLLPQSGAVPGAAIGQVPADHRVHVLAESEVVAVPVAGEVELVLARPAVGPWRQLWGVGTFAMLAAFWSLAVLVIWLVVRGLVGPLRQLANRLPEIERFDPIELPAAERKDEIGDVARAFLRTREALRQAREQGQRAEQLAMLGRMTAALAHEIQNPIAAIKMHAQLWQGSDATDTARLIEREAARIEDMLNQWMFLCRPEPPSMHEVQVSQLLAQVLATHRPWLDHALVKAALDADAGLVVQGDGKRLAQVFSNLVVNAIQAMPGGGELRIEARRLPDAVRVLFMDTGKGFSSLALGRFAEFFFSEKEGGMGIGLGVATGIVRAHGGEIGATNKPTGGACVVIRLPLPPAARRGVATAGPGV